jgi:hypothetical protein
MSLDPFPCTRAAVPLLGYGRGKSSSHGEREKGKKREITINYYFSFQSGTRPAGSRLSILVKSVIA